MLTDMKVSLKGQIKTSKMRLKLNQNKIDGILPWEFNHDDIHVSYSKEHRDFGHMSHTKQWFIICQENRAYKAWKGFSIFSSLISSYFYAYMAAFRAPVLGEQNFTIMLVFELIFLCSMGFKFLNEYTKDGSTNPTRDLKKIAEKYLRSDFIFDLIPLLPLPLVLD